MNFLESVPFSLPCIVDATSLVIFSKVAIGLGIYAFGTMVCQFFRNVVISPMIPKSASELSLDVLHQALQISAPLFYFPVPILSFLRFRDKKLKISRCTRAFSAPWWHWLQHANAICKGNTNTKLEIQTQKQRKWRGAKPRLQTRSGMTTPSESTHGVPPHRFRAQASLHRDVTARLRHPCSQMSPQTKLASHARHVAIIKRESTAYPRPQRLCWASICTRHARNYYVMVKNQCSILPEWKEKS